MPRSRSRMPRRPRASSAGSTTRLLCHARARIAFPDRSSPARTRSPCTPAMRPATAARRRARRGRSFPGSIARPCSLRPASRGTGGSARRSGGRRPTSVARSPAPIGGGAPWVWRPAADERGSLTGAYRSGVTLGGAGAILDDLDTAAAFDGFSGEALLPGPVLSVNGTLEGWFEWRNGIAVLRDHASGGGWIPAFVPAGGTIVMSRAGGGATLNTGINVQALRDGWHHLVLTKAGSNL